MEITASLVKELRERTGAGMMDCKAALKDANGDIESAIEIMRKSGAAKAAKKAGRIAAEGIISIKQKENNIVMIEVNCETDFVAKDDNFLSFSEAIVDVIMEHDVNDIDNLLKLNFGNQTIEEATQQLVTKIGEKVTIRRFEKCSIKNQVGIYLHGTRIGVVVEIEGGDQELAKDIAMHIAALKPMALAEEDLDPTWIESEKKVFIEQAQQSGKPMAIIFISNF